MRTKETDSIFPFIAIGFLVICNHNHTLFCCTAFGSSQIDIHYLRSRRAASWSPRFVAFAVPSQTIDISLFCL